MPATTLDPNNLSAVTLSGGNLVATTSGVGFVSSTRSFTAMQTYFEAVATTLTGVMAIGVATRSYVKGVGTILGTGLTGAALKSSGAFVINNVTVATIFSFVQGDRIGVAVNIQLQLIWFTKNGTTWNNDIIANQNPVGNVGGLSLASMTFASLLAAFGSSLTGAVWTTIFTSGSFTYTPPTGYVSADGTAVTARNSEVASNGATYTTTAGVMPAPVTTVIAARASFLGPGRNNSRNGGAQTPATASPTAVSGTVKEGLTLVAGKAVRAYDSASGDLLGTATSDGSGAFSIPALGRTSVDVVAKDPTTFQAEIYDRVTPV